MKSESLESLCSEVICPDSELVQKHLKTLEQMVRIDSRSFGVNEFEGDRTTPSDMREILECARDYLLEIGLSEVKINNSRFPILMAETFVSEEKPTVLFYAHLDKQPYMDDGRFKKWGGTPPTQLRWNEDRSRAYGRGAADDLSGVVSIGMAIDAIFKHVGIKTGENPKEKISQLPCNIKIIYETEEESGSHSLIDQIHENEEFFKGIHCVVITDVVNPAQGKPGLTTSLRGIIQMDVTVGMGSKEMAVDEQTALYKLLATLIREDHSLGIPKISNADRLVTDAEREGYVRVPTSVSALKEAAGLLPNTRLTVSEDVPSMLIAQLRTSFANARPGHRVTGSVILGAAGARLTFPGIRDSKEFKRRLEKILTEKNRYNLELKIEIVSPLSIDIILRSSEKDPHSGVNGGPVPVAELQLACMIDELISSDGQWHPQLEEMRTAEETNRVQVQALRVDHDLTSQLFEEKSARSWVEIRLAPGNNEFQAEEALRSHLEKNLSPGFELDIKADKGASPWMTEIAHPVFPLILNSLEKGFGEKACLYGCGGTIPFVAKLMQALGNVHPLCLGAYDPACRMHEPGESLSMPDLMGCTRAIIYFLLRIDEGYRNPDA
ncbi:MAG TPA: M20/M25/M40 family metallo-hydrolase [Nitrospinaceae bacterium]|jgi:acetylornithine deacetylase/succinyl-diaminopimelate desuccinylase-like protein|nr:M20/M25/M40 family metallo-hydrolase [Nitrospinaceae bacterium]